MRKENILCFDIETTGLNPLEDEILQISIVNGTGNTLFNEYVKPTRHTEWAETEAINGISPGKVANCRTVSECLPELRKIFSRAELIVGYNCDRFDLAFLERAGLEIDPPTFDVMREYMPIVAEIDENGSYKRQNLRKCSAHYGYEGEGWHDSLADAKATLHCFYGVIRDQGWTVTDGEIEEPTTMRAVRVRPGMPAEIVMFGNDLAPLQNEVGGYIEAVYPFNEPVALICNEEGKIRNLPLNRALYDNNGRAYDIIHGTFLIVGIGSEDFCSLTEKQAERFAEFYRDPSVFRADKAEPEYPDAHLTGERVYTIRGAFLLTDLTYDQMQKAGYGIHHGSEDRKYWIMSNGADAFAVRRDPPKPDMNVTHEPPKGMKV